MITLFKANERKELFSYGMYGKELQPHVMRILKRQYKEDITNGGWFDIRFAATYGIDLSVLSRLRS